ncbi:hypothetical protein SVIO_110260 [Streptomyces violaceusniger]|uniref:Fumarylacetoacetase-like C-terminal domain-containing protein n=1 Tax=Streptomyces violaceusniger TaxID=68280 RepID=A0A4D4LQN9_STRVO|nr:hypothetical protein SVIO_110260 [Streptomyces violaceusniger]
MKLATVRTDNGLRTVRVEDGGYVDLGPGDLGGFLAHADWQSRAADAQGPRLSLDRSQLAPVIPQPGKIVCVGLNYRTHITEMGRDLPEFPTLFAKYPEALIGPNDPLTLPEESDAVDWEAELVVVVGQRVRRADRAAAEAAIAGYTILNDVTLRDWQFRTREWLQGKTWEATTPSAPTWSLRTSWPRTPRSAAPSTTRSCRSPTSATCSSTPPTWSATSRRSSPSTPGT